MKSTEPAMIEIAGLAGFNFVIFDMEHGPISFEILRYLIPAAELRNLVSVVRIAENNKCLISKALDLGAKAIQVPQVSSRVSAENVVFAAKFYPKGTRGVCRYVRAADYSSKNKTDYFLENNSEISVIIQLEGKEAIDNFDEIVKVEGIDVYFLGPYDLSQSIGYPGEINHPKVENLMKEIVKKAAIAGKFVGTFVETPESATKWIKLGVKYISYSVDVGIYFNACSSIVDYLKENENF